MKTILVTGASGFIGKYLVNKFNSNYDVIGLDINDYTEKEECLFYKQDMRDYEKLEKIFKENKIDYIIHLAAEKSLIKCEENPKEAYKINFQGSKHLHEISKQYKSKFIFISSDQVFDGEKGEYLESDTPIPINNYGKLKLEMENILKNDPTSVICRTALNFGKIPSIQKKYFDFVKEKDYLVVQGFIVEHLIYRLNNNLKIILPESEYINPTSLNQLYKQLKAIIERDVTGIIHCCGGEKISRYEFGKKIAKIFNLNSEFISPEDSYDPLRPKDVSLKYEESEKKLSLKYDSIDEMLLQIKDEIYEK